MKVQLDYVSEENCTESFRSDIGTKQLPRGVTGSMLCAGIMEGGKDTCQVIGFYMQNHILSKSKDCIVIPPPPFSPVIVIPFSR